MCNRIIVCGGNGAGKSTLGKQLAQKLNYKFMDIEDYYFPKTDANYIYSTARSREEVSSLLLEDMKRHKNFILASVKGDYGDEIVSMFTCGVYINMPRDIRLKRVRDRAFGKFGDRMLPGGDLYEREQRFFDMVERRPEQYVEDWLKSLSIPIITIDGTKSVDFNVEVVLRSLVDCYGNW